jgi:ankyrin repeat protein
MSTNNVENYNHLSGPSNWGSYGFNSFVPMSPVHNYGYGPGTPGQFASVPPFTGPNHFPTGQQFLMADWGSNPVPDGNVYGTGDFRKDNTGFQKHVNFTASIPPGTTAVNHKDIHTFHIAAMGGNVNAVEWLLETYPQSVDLATDNGVTPVVLAAQEGHAKIVKLFCDLNANVNATLKDCNRKAIHQAAQEGHTSVVELLLKYGAEHDPEDIRGVTPFWSACQGGHMDIVRILLSKGVRSEQIADNGRTPIHQAAQNGHLEVVKILLTLDVNIDLADDGVTPLWIASQCGHYEIVKLLLDKDADCETMSKNDSRRPIHQAAQNGHFKVVEALLEAGALASPEKDCFDNKTPSPLYLAAQSGHFDVAKILLEYDADPNFVVREKGTTPVLTAVYKGAIKTVELLLDHGANVNCPNSDGWCPLMVAAQKSDCGMINLLLSRGAAVNAENKGGATALFIASHHGNATAVSRLFAAGAKSLSTKKIGRRPIHQAAQNGHYAVVRLLVEHDQREVDMADNNGVTPIALAAGGKETNRLTMMKYLNSKRSVLPQAL